MFPILTDDFLNSFSNEFSDFLAKINGYDSKSCSCGENCKCKKPSCEVNTNCKDIIINKTYYDWEEFDGKYTKSIALPCSKENITLHVVDGEKVTIDYEETSVNESLNSFETHTFSGSITFLLPPDADETTLSAKFQDDFLILSVDKLVISDVKPTRKIEIK